MLDEPIPLDMPDLTIRPLFEFTCTVKQRNQYGDKSVATYPAVVLAPTIGDAVVKLRTAFGAKYDDFRKFWSHDVFLESVKEYA